jgi:hypothetical protein
MGHVPLRRLAFQSASLVAAVPLKTLTPKGSPSPVSTEVARCSPAPGLFRAMEQARTMEPLSLRSQH